MVGPGSEFHWLGMSSIPFEVGACPELLYLKQSVPPTPSLSLVRIRPWLLPHSAPQSVWIADEKGNVTLDYQSDEATDGFPVGTVPPDAAWGQLLIADGSPGQVRAGHLPQQRPGRAELCSYPASVPGQGPGGQAGQLPSAAAKEYARRAVCGARGSVPANRLPMEDTRTAGRSGPDKSHS